MKKMLKNSIHIISLFLMLVMAASHAKPVKNGFDLSNITIPVNKVLQGGPPRDGIPSIDMPQFMSADDVRYLEDEDRILGINYKGESRAYPIRILNWHEIVNDKIDKHSIAVTYCPLCGSGIVYKADIEGKAYQFGVSGLLYNSDVLLYDRQTDTLWSQILSKAVSGELVDTELEIIQSAHTSWKDWRTKYPDTKVLSTETGFSRDYSKSPYGSYDESLTTYFPVEFKSKRYHPKERVLGVTLNGKQKAYPFAELAKLEDAKIKDGRGELSDSFSNEALTIVFDVENRDGVVKNSSGDIIPSINTFWFAWYGFHPKGEIYKAK